MFKVGTPVFLEDFIDRKEELQLLKFYLTECDNQSVMIHAPRRFGKTSLIKESFRQLEKHNPYLLYFDLKHYSSLTHLSKDILENLYAAFGVNRFWEVFKNGIISFLRHIKPTLNIRMYQVIELSLEPVEHITKEPDPILAFIKSIELLQIVAHKAQVQLKIAFDEFQDLYTLTTDPRIIDKLRSTVQQQTNVAYIFCGSHETLMNHIFLDKRSAFFHFSRIISLGPLDKQELTKYIVKRFNKINVILDKEGLSHILDELECHPYYSMKTMQILHSLILTSRNPISLVPLDLLYNAYELAFQETKSYIEDIINYVKKKVHHFDMLISIAKESNFNLDPLNSYRVRQSLINMGLIKSQSRGKYVIIDSFLKKYLKGIN